MVYIYYMGIKEFFKPSKNKWLIFGVLVALSLISRANLFFPRLMRSFGVTFSYILSPISAVVSILYMPVALIFLILDAIFSSWGLKLYVIGFPGSGYITPLGWFIFIPLYLLYTYFIVCLFVFIHSKVKSRKKKKK